MALGESSPKTNSQTKHRLATSETFMPDMKNSQKSIKLNMFFVICALFASASGPGNQTPSLEEWTQEQVLTRHTPNVGELEHMLRQLTLVTLPTPVQHTEMKFFEVSSASTSKIDSRIDSKFMLNFQQLKFSS